MLTWNAFWLRVPRRHWHGCKNYLPYFLSSHQMSSLHSTCTTLWNNVFINLHIVFKHFNHWDITTYHSTNLIGYYYLIQFSTFCMCTQSLKCSLSPNTWIIIHFPDWDAKDLLKYDLSIKDANWPHETIWNRYFCHPVLVMVLQALIHHKSQNTKGVYFLLCR